MTYRISGRANADIEAICNYIAQDNPEAADHIDLRIHTTIEMLSRFPRMGHSRQDVSDQRYLFWTVGTYVIA
ncbi:MAG: type II toxin-antitoxin system RelE/ParE family toxin [Candidatus Obscuribacterales bacterium]|nr:type II toxin-antitoxin system RelE/ParE family toxin [Candidatus Obscuribacterales bacterium]